MFSNITNQFTSLVGAVKGGQGDEDVPVPNSGQEAPASAVPVQVQQQQPSTQLQPDVPTGEEPGLESEDGAKRYVLILKISKLVIYFNNYIISKSLFLK